ncbi:CAP domain-containing protein [Azohydromonas caseinilytica]|uniref:CAP domain-containing protein n=1 Tax=Azohydromonas caseinilytica TaxID=2728836 RepID=A0A848F2R5_9BURK|nr:hypothetical protein [Azohydromonas caseinilytica]NML13964.1 CAP domain-containing protein [Azohydromonas caseinilytica]
MPDRRLMHRSRLAACALAAALLAACGGGGGDDGTPAVSPTPVNPSVPASGYASAEQRTLYEQLNTLRLGAGAGVVLRDTRLDASAAAHLNYLRLNGVSAGHAEVQGQPGFTGASIGRRAEAAGYVFQLVSEDLAWGTSFTPMQCLDLLLSSVYHLAGLMGEQRDMGVAYGPVGGKLNGCVFNFGVRWGTAPQQRPGGVAVTYPYPGQSGVATSFAPATELPNPMPDVGSRRVGQPVFVSMRAQGSSDAAGYAVSSFTLQDANGSAVPARLIGRDTAGTSADPQSHLRPGEVFLVPLAPLAAGARYTVRFAGRNGSVPYEAGWSFTTR